MLFRRVHNTKIKFCACGQVRASLHCNNPVIKFFCLIFYFRTGLSSLSLSCSSGLSTPSPPPSLRRRLRRLTDPPVVLHSSLFTSYKVRWRIYNSIISVSVTSFLLLSFPLLPRQILPFLSVVSIGGRNITIDESL